MTNIVDRRNTKDRSAADRKKFIRRYKKVIKEKVDIAAGKRNIKDVASSGTDVTINKKDLTEPSIGYNSDTGEWEHIVTRNNSHDRGDIIRVPGGDGSGGRKAGRGGKGEDEFTFTLTTDEFMDIYFEDMALPNFIKKALIDSTKFINKRAGYSKEGPPPRLNIKKTMEHAIARRGDDEDSPYLDEVDLRYNHFTKVPEPISKAVMFCVLDVSASMTEDLKDLAKRFFLLLYLFLTKSYTTVDIRFIRHTDDAKEVSEKVFFYDMETGGTMVVSGMECVKEIIDKDYNLEEYNIYVAQVSDGEDWAPDTATEFLIKELLPIVQYYCYVETKGHYGWQETLYSLWQGLESQFQNFKTSLLKTREDVYPAFRELFKK